MPRSIVVSSGAKHSLFNAIFSLFGPGDEVLIPVPTGPPIPRSSAWPGPSRTSPRLAGAGLSPHSPPSSRPPQRASPGGSFFAPHPIPSGPFIPWRSSGPSRSGREIEASGSSPTRSTGSSISRVRGLPRASWTCPRNLEAPFVVVDGASKAFAMTGWRIGHSYSDPAVAKKMADLQSHMTSNPSSPAQMAALAAFTDWERSMGEVGRMVAAFRRRRDLATRLLDELPPAPLLRAARWGLLSLLPRGSPLHR